MEVRYSIGFNSGPYHSGSPNPSCVYFSNSGMNHCNNNWRNLHIGSLNSGEQIIMVENTKWKPLKLPLPRKIVNQSNMALLVGLQSLVAPSRHARCGGGDFHHIPIQLAYLACEENRWTLENNSGLC